jgi:hypothetical protein
MVNGSWRLKEKEEKAIEEPLLLSIIEPLTCYCKWFLKAGTMKEMIMVVA